MPTANINVRSAYKGQFTTLKRDIDNISRNSDALLDDDMLETLFLHRQNLEGIERKFCDVQRTIIDDAKGDSKKTEQEEMENFLKETASVTATINRFIAKIQAASAKRAAASTVKVTQPSASGSQSSSDLSTVLNLMTNQLKEQKEQRLQDKAIMEQLVDELKRLSSGNGGNIGGSNQNETFTINPQPRRKLDVIKIRPFSGDYTEWKTFKDLFDSIIGKDEVLTASEKMQYLKTLVVGDAQPIIESLNVCDANYTVAWDLLNREFDSTAPIVASYVKDFFSLPAVMDPTVQGIQNIQRKSNSILQALDAMSVTSRDAFIIHTILQKLDDETRVLWAGKVKKDCPTWTQFNDFLVDRSFQLRMSQPENSETCPRPAKLVSEDTYLPHFLHGELQPLTLLTKSPDSEHWVSSEETYSTKDKEIGTSYIRWSELHYPVQLPNKQHVLREGFWYRLPVEMSNSVPRRDEDAAGFEVNRVCEAIANDVGGSVENLGVLRDVVGNEGALTGDGGVDVCVEGRNGGIFNGEWGVGEERILRTEGQNAIRVNLPKEEGKNQPK
uniref:Uncharacterized protein n=1 Tax=Lutzomyia longipalpis TaxID=7200 RepID=A0A1B0ET75_LUTLO